MQQADYSILKQGWWMRYHLQKRAGIFGEWKTIYRAWKREQCEAYYCLLKKEGRL